MFILKNALRNISRSKGRSILIGIIITIIAFSVCIGLCIRQSAADAKESALADMTITAQISPDRGVAMEGARDKGSGTFDKSKMKDLMASNLSLSEMKKYAKADAVQSFYYTLSASVNGSGSLEAYSSSGDSESSESSAQGGPGVSFKGMGDSGDFSIVGYSSDKAMTDFTDGTYSIKKGKVFEEGTSDMVCIISDELAEYNSLSVGDYIKISNPDNDSETYKLKITGIYTNSQSSADAAGMHGGPFTDPANYIYTSYKTLNKIVSASKSANDDEDTSAITGRLNGTYVVGDMAGYEDFCNQVEKLGLSDDYTVSSTDIEQYERSAEPLENLAKYAGYFLLVILIIGAIILIVVNIFATRERKYEIGVLTAIGMKKSRVAKLFISEIIIIALAGVIVGGAVGAAVSVPVTNTLLQAQTESQASRMNDKNQAFGRDFNPGSFDSSQSGDSENSSNVQNPPSDNGNAQKGPGNYISQVSSSVNIVVLLELLICCIVLAVLGGIVSVVAIMRYEPLQILSNRD